MLNFPNSPSIDQIHESGTKQWQWNGSAWISLDLTEPSAPVFEFETGKIVHTGNTPPVDPIDNMLWYNADEGYLAIF